MKHIEPKEIKVQPHIHVLLFLCPSATFAEKIRLYISKTWTNSSIEEYKQEKVNKRNASLNISFAEYIFKQATTLRFINENWEVNMSDFPSSTYNFRKLYSAYLEFQTNQRGQQIKSRKIEKKSVLKYNELKDFYNNHQKKHVIEVKQ